MYAYNIIVKVFGLYILVEKVLFLVKKVKISLGNEFFKEITFLTQQLK